MTDCAFLPLAVRYLTRHQVWELSKCKLRTNHFGHTGYITTVTVSPDGSLCASGGKDGITMLWDLNEGKHLYSLEAGDIINALVFSPNRWVVVFLHERSTPPVHFQSS